ncbi:hypothetical protein FF125_15835 [Aureibaculum algae]|uniref:Uncharacterized protein n=1 Tax=Aureibaculum algae TaxID=2584122 RepID=A0A5B7TYH1_9FLAO|nr:hypothetical protein [Aureibaculum algae]QCX39837.1 hypothetical protein FF125_15835 [Aureibaculum algae]
MFKTIKILCLFILSILLFSCQNDETSEENQEIYFEKFSVNYAWGLNYNHWIIDNEGNVRVNKERDSIIWIDTDNLNSYKEMFDSIVFKVDKSELEEYVALISKAAKGKVVETKQNRADFGSVGFNCFTKNNHNYKTVVLTEMSDLLDKKNLSTEAEKIAIWLKELNLKMNSN